MPRSPRKSKKATPADQVAASAASPATAQGSTTAGAQVTIQAVDMAFQPETLTANAGDTLVFDCVNGKHGIRWKTQGVYPNSPILTGGHQWTMPVPLQKGTYDYDCTVHGSMMPGTVIVD